MTLPEPIIVAVIAFFGACVLATPGFLAWREGRKNRLSAERSADRAAEAAANAAEAQATAALVAEAIKALDIRVDGRLTQLLEVTRSEATAIGHAEGVAAEQSRTREAEK